MASSEEIDLQGIFPENYNLPSTHVVEAIKDRYIKARILNDFLKERFPGDAIMESRLSFHVYIAPRKLTQREIRKLQEKNRVEDEKAKKERDARRKGST